MHRRVLSMTFCNRNPLQGEPVAYVVENLNNYNQGGQLTPHWYLTCTLYRVNNLSFSYPISANMVLAGVDQKGVQWRQSNNCYTTNIIYQDQSSHYWLVSYRDFREIILFIVLAALSRQDPNNGLYHTLFVCCPHMPKDCGSSQSSPYDLMIKNRPRTLFVYLAFPQQRSSISSDFIVNVYNPSRPVLLL